jgi:hypothetical protein
MLTQAQRAAFYAKWRQEYIQTGRKAALWMMEAFVSIDPPPVRQPTLREALEDALNTPPLELIEQLHHAAHVGFRRGLLGA